MTMPRLARDLLGCDTARVTRPLRRWFLVAGWNRQTRDEKTGRWLRNGEPRHFAYIEEKAVASGRTLAELEASLREYHRRLGVSMLEFLAERALP